MKRFFSYAIVSTLFVTALTTVGCASHGLVQEESTSQSEATVKKSDDYCAGTRSYMPEGTRTSLEKDGSMRYELPKGFVSIEGDSSTGYRYVTAGTITCTCDKGTGDCSPVSHSSGSGCFMGANCSACSKSGAKVVVKIDSAVRFASKDELDTLPSVDSEMFEVPEIKRALIEFRTIVAKDAGLSSAEALEDAGEERTTASATASSGRVYVPINLFGRLAVISVPREYAAARTMVAGSSATCTCNAGSGCVAGSMLGAKFCKAGSCTSCSLSTGAFSTDWGAPACKR
jgi:hypothetical protein